MIKSQYSEIQLKIPSVDTFLSNFSSSQKQIDEIEHRLKEPSIPFDDLRELLSALKEMKFDFGD